MADFNRQKNQERKEWNERPTNLTRQGSSDEPKKRAELQNDFN